MLNDIIDDLFSIHYMVLIEPWKIVCDALVCTKMYCGSNIFYSDATTYSLLHPTNGALVVISNFIEYCK